MYAVTYSLGTSEQALARAFFAYLFDALIRCNVLILRAYPDLPLRHLVTIKSENPGEFRTALQLHKDGAGTPLDMLALRLARQVIAGQPIALPSFEAWTIPDKIKFFTGAFRGDYERPLSIALLAELLEALVRCDELIFRTYPTLPGIYASGVFYKREPRGEEFWQTVLALYRQGYGDCEDLASGLTAEKRVRHRRPGVRAGFTWRRRAGGGTMYHIIQSSETGKHEDDPSARLGMLEGDR